MTQRSSNRLASYLFQLFHPLSPVSGRWGTGSGSVRVAQGIVENVHLRSAAEAIVKGTRTHDEGEREKHFDHHNASV